MRWIFLALKKAMLRKVTIIVRQILIKHANLTLRNILVAGISTISSRRTVIVPSTRVDSAALDEGKF